MTTSTAQRPLTGRTVLICLLGFFGVVVGVNMTMMKLAIDTLPGTEVASAYRASLAFNSEISAARAQDTRGWQVAAHVERAGDGRASVRIEARDGGGALVTGATFSGRLARPATTRDDRPVALAERESGVYRGAADDVAPGQWDLIIEAERGGERLFRSRNRVVLK